MFRKIFLTSLAILILGPVVSPLRADVFVRAPFVRVEVGQPGVHVRAPFVNIFVPASRPVPVAPAVIPENLPFPQEMPSAGETIPPPKSQPTRPPTLEEFARTFQARSGLNEVVLLNPVNGQPTQVRFILPEGTPRRVDLSRREIEFNYGPRRFVRIHFDGDGAVVTSR